MKCTNCNAENSSDALFCSECGTKFSSPVPEQVPASEDLAATPSDAPAPEEIGASTEGVLDAPADLASDMIEDPVDELEIPEDAPSPFAPTASVFSEETQAVAATVPAIGFQENTPPAAPTIPTPEFQPQAQQPAFAPVPQPMAPVVPSAPVVPTENKISPSGEKKSKKFFVPMIIFIILFALAAAGLGVGAYLYMKQKSDLNTKIEDRDKEIDKKEGEISDLEDQVTELSDENATLENDKLQLNADISRLNKDVEKLNNDVKAAEKDKEDFKNLLDISSNQLKEVYAAIANLTPPAESLFASRNVVILKPGASETITISKRHSGSFNITSSANNKLISSQFGSNSEWKDDGNLHTNTFTITAGNTVGQTVITFSTNADADKCQILVIIAE